MKFSAVPDHVLTSRYLKKDIRAWAIDLPNFIDHAMVDPNRMRNLLGPDILVAHFHELLDEANNQNGIIALKNTWNLFLHNPLWDIREDALDDYLGCNDSVEMRTGMLIDGLAGKPGTKGTGSPNTIFVSQLDRTPGLGGLTTNLVTTEAVERIIDETWRRDPDHTKMWLDVTSRSLDSYSQREIDIIKESRLLQTWLLTVYRDNEQDCIDIFCIGKQVTSDAFCATIAHGNGPIRFDIFADGFRRSVMY